MDVRNICIMGKKLKFDSFTGGCHTPLIHAAIDRTLTTIPNETSSVLYWSYWKKKLPSLGGRLVSCHISIHQIWTACGGFTLLLSTTTQLRAIFFRSSKNIAFRTVTVLALHKTLRLKDSCSNSDCFRDWSRSMTLFRRDFYCGSNPNSLRINCLNEQI